MYIGKLHYLNHHRPIMSKAKHDQCIKHIKTIRDLEGFYKALANCTNVIRACHCI